MLTSDEITEIVARVAARLRPQKVILFGSYAKGAATARSDLDLFVIQQTPLPPERRASRDGVGYGTLGAIVPASARVAADQALADMSSGRIKPRTDLGRP